MKGLTPKTAARERAKQKRQRNQLTRLAVLGPMDPAAGLAELAEADRRHRAALAETEDPIMAKLAEDLEPEPAPTSNGDHLEDAYQAARQAFDGDRGQLDRLGRALELVKAGAVNSLGGGQFQVASSNGRPYRVGAACECADYAWRGETWCKHRLAVGLVLKAEQIKEEAGSGNHPGPQRCPQGDNTQEDNTTTLDLAQVAAIRPVWGTGHQTDLDLQDGQRRRVNVAHHQAETQVQALGWTEGTPGSGYWMAPAS